MLYEQADRQASRAVQSTSDNRSTAAKNDDSVCDGGRVGGQGFKQAN